MNRLARCAILQFSMLMPSSNPGRAVASRRAAASAAGGEAVEVEREVNEINMKFAEAREEIEAAIESKDTVYFNEEADCARQAAKEVLDKFDGLLAKLPNPNDAAALRRSMGLKMEQLKAELRQLDD